MCWRMCEKVSVCSHDITQWLMTNTQCMKSGGSGEGKLVARDDCMNWSAAWSAIIILTV